VIVLNFAGAGPWDTLEARNFHPHRWPAVLSLGSGRKAKIKNIPNQPESVGFFGKKPPRAALKNDRQLPNSYEPMRRLQSVLA
jgi:hypothetical protein